jgi:hypothetical protein
MTPLAVPPDATSRVPPLIVVATADPPELTISPPPLKMSVPLDRPPRSTVSRPVARRVPEVVPSDETTSVPPLDTVVLIAVPALSCDPANTLAPLTRPRSIWIQCQPWHWNAAGSASPFPVPAADCPCEAAGRSGGCGTNSASCGARSTTGVQRLEVLAEIPSSPPSAPGSPRRASAAPHYRPGGFDWRVGRRCPRSGGAWYGHAAESSARTPGRIGGSNRPRESLTGRAHWKEGPATLSAGRA